MEAYVVALNESCLKKNIGKRKVNEIFFVLLQPE